VTSPTFIVASTDRVASKASSAATFSFTTSVGGALAATLTHKITLNYPIGFFATSPAPTAATVATSGVKIVDM
jgi:hypothetical protein